VIPFPAPIAEAYRQSGALEIPCPHCGAAAETYCTRSDGRVRRAPCVSRCHISSAVPESLDPITATDTAGGRSAPTRVIHDVHQVHDPSEPRHQRDNQ
jgi:hypothetical protein